MREMRKRDDGPDQRGDRFGGLPAALSTFFRQVGRFFYVRPLYIESFHGTTGTDQPIRCRL